MVFYRFRGSSRQDQSSKIDQSSKFFFPVTLTLSVKLLALCFPRGPLSLNKEKHLTRQSKKGTRCRRTSKSRIDSLKPLSEKNCEVYRNYTSVLEGIGRKEVPNITAFPILKIPFISPDQNWNNRSLLWRSPLKYWLPPPLPDVVKVSITTD